MNSIRRHWRWAFVVIALASMSWLLQAQWQEIRELEWQVRLEVMVPATLALVVVFFLDAVGWHVILRALGAETSVRANCRVWLLSSLGRYVPGAVWGYVGRIAMCAELGIPTATTVLAMYLETVMLCAGAITAGLPALAQAVGLPIDTRSGLLLGVALVLSTHSWFLGLLRHLPGRVGRAFATAKLPDAGRMLAVYLYYVMFWIAFGAVFTAFVAALHPLPADGGALLVIGASMGLAFAAGFVAVFAPAGIGVREAVLYALLLPLFAPPVCLLIAIGSRVWIMAGEAVAVALTMSVFSPHRK